jgi:NAD(P)H-dependent flavin oxidoreductase YrpB (nitropropane dioxygenase family)
MSSQSADFTSGLGLELPVVQAGMAGGVAGAELAGAVSVAGALGTVGMMGVRAFASALSGARRLARSRPVAANLLVPFIREGHVRACAEAEVALVVLHGGPSKRWVRALRRRGLRVFVTVGTPAQATRALREGANGLVVQGIEAGGHLLGVEPTGVALERVREVAGGAALLAAGGVADGADVRRLLDLGASAAVAGTRFLLTDESQAHPGYKQRAIEARRTLATDLFGFGWPLRHRVVPNAATERWCARDERGPVLARFAGWMGAPAGRIAPMEQMSRLAAMQRVGVPIFTPALPLSGTPAEALDRCALYAGETALRIDEVVPAALAVERLAP